MNDDAKPHSVFRQYINLKIGDLAPAAVAVVPAAVAATLPFLHAMHGNDCEIVDCHVYAPAPLMHPADLPERHVPIRAPLQVDAYMSGSSTMAVFRPELPYVKR